VFDGKESGTPVAYCGGELWAIAGNAQSSDALAGLQQLMLSTRGFAFGGTDNALTMNGVTAAQVLADAVRVESGLVRTAPPSVNMFAAITPSMNTPHQDATATLLPNGKVLIVGFGSMEMYDPVTNTFAPPASTPVMNTARSGATATLVPNGKVLIAGGYIGSPPYSLASTELYDPATNTFAAAGSTPVMNYQRIGDTATLLPNGKVLIAAGYNYSSSTPPPGTLASTELYNPVTNKFAPAASTPVMTTPREYATATLLPNGKVLIAGGEFTPGQTTLKSTELYTP
jgi:hypothetical protein